MQKIEHKQFKETLFYEGLPNGLRVYILPKEGYNKTYATFTTKYGSIDQMFQVPGRGKVTVPDGVAHFLEHKMFEQPDGEDVFQAFSRQGASANAFTSFTRTAYLFSCTEHVEENVNTLLDFVQTPYFTEENVEKEKGIIAQEIQMYYDNPDWRVYFGLIQAMYQAHPVRIDIAGTVESIAKITKDILYDCYHTFYHPSNMILFVVGAVDPEQMIQLIKKNQEKKQFSSQATIQRFLSNEPDPVAKPRNEVQMSVKIAKCSFGFKEKKAALNKTGEELLRHEMLTEIALDAMIGQSSDLYQSLYDDGLIDDHFSYSYVLEKEYGFSMMGGDIADPDALLKRIKKELPQVVEKGITEETFDRILKQKIGGYLRSFNSLEWIANQFTSYRFHGVDLFCIIPLLEKITVDDINQRMKEHVDWDQWACSIISPSDEEKTG